MESSSNPFSNPPAPTSGWDLLREWLQRGALLIKVMGISLLALILLIPLGLVWNTLRERQNLHQNAVNSITAPWGGPQQLLGPVLVVPFTYQLEVGAPASSGDQLERTKSLREETGEAYFLPEQLNVTGDLTPLELRRGIYTTHVFTAKLAVSGRFAPPDLKQWEGLRGFTPHWDRARVGLSISDLRGASGTFTLNWAGVPLVLQPGSQLNALFSGDRPGAAQAVQAELANGVHGGVPLAAGQGADFSLALTLNGSGSFMLAPLAAQTQVTLRSPWHAPSFGGAYLPVTRTVTAQGFTADWNVSYYGRSFPQQWASSSTSLGEPRPDESQLTPTIFGVTLAEPMDTYAMVDRSIRYGVLFIALVFTAFFLFEISSDLRLNGLNYLLVGGALCLFFLSLLALTEVIGFGPAYTLAAAVAVLMIGGYSRAVLRSNRRALTVAGLLSGVFGYLFFVLRLEDYALLAGTAALIVVLAAVMFATRRLSADGAAVPVGRTGA